MNYKGGERKMSIHTRLDNSLNTVKTQTRAERRRLEKEQQKNKAVYTVTREQLEQYKKDIYRDFVENERKYVDDVIFNCFVIALNKELGLGKKRLTNVLEEVREQLDCLKLGYLSLDDLKQLSESLQGKADKIR